MDYEQCLLLNDIQIVFYGDHLHIEKLTNFPFWNGNTDF